MQIPASLIRKFLGQIDLLRDLTPEDLDALVPHLELLRAEAGQGVFMEGAEGQALYIVLEGHVTIQRKMPSGPEHELAVLHPGECFGEMALLDGAPRMATASTLDDSLLARLSRGSFDALIDQDPALGSRLLRSMARVICDRQRELTIILQELVDFEVEQQGGGDQGGDEQRSEQQSREQEALNQAVLRHVTWN